MTREELREHCERQIQQFERVEKIMPVTPNDWKRYEEHKLILELLEQEPCDDTISRQAAIDEIEYELEMINSALDSMTLDFNARERLRQRRGEAREILNSIQQLPSVTPKPKMGRWIMPQQDDGMSDPIYYQVRCSECNFDLDPQTWYQELHQYGADKYCPNCGATMRKEKTDVQ